MKNLKFLISICIILLGFTLNSQTNRNIGMSETADAFAITSKGTDLQNSIFIGHNSTATTGFASATGNTALGVGALDAIKKGDNNVAIDLMQEQKVDEQLLN